MVLGPIGANFAAGMSGGRAFLYDPDQQAKANLNLESVALLPVPATDLALLTQSLKAHAQETGSPLARDLLAKGAEGLKAFVAVIPKEILALKGQGVQKSA